MEFTCPDAGLARHLKSQGFRIVRQSGSEFVFAHRSFAEMNEEVANYYETHRPMLTRGFSKNRETIQTPGELLAALTGP